MILIIGLVVLAFVLFFLEIFVPGGILAIGGCILIIMASSLAWTEIGPMWGIMLFSLSVISAIGLFFLEIQLISKTRFGEQFSLRKGMSGNNPSMPKEKLDGKVGVALTTMAPSGKVEVEKKVYTASAQNGFIERGTAIKVSHATPFKLIVTKK